MITCGALLTPNIENYDEFKFQESQQAFPENYELTTLEVFNQGEKGSCVSCAATEMMNFRSLLKGEKPSRNFEEIFNKRKNKKVNGMMPVEAFEILKTEKKISSYARISSILPLKQSIITAGAVMAVLPVLSYNNQFWEGDMNYGFHAVAVTGWSKNGFLIKNSWGIEWGNNGFTTLPYSDFNKIKELWRILKFV